MSIKIEEWHLFPFLREIDNLFVSGTISESQSVDLKRVVMQLESHSLIETNIIQTIKNLRSFKKKEVPKKSEIKNNLIDERIVSILIKKFRIFCANLMCSGV